jgi:hypothetical protein
VCCLAVALARLPAIATRYCSTLAPSSPRGRLHQSRGRRPGRTAGDRALRDPDQATARPIGSRCAASPSPWHHLPAIATRYCSTLALSSPRGRFHRSRGRSPGRTAGDRAPPARIRPRPARSAAGALPVCRLAVALARLPAIATRYCSTLAPSSLRGRLHQLRGQRPGRTAGDRAPPALTRPRQPRLASPRPLTKPRPARSAAGVLPRLRPGPLAGDRLPVLLDPGAVIASWPASPIERTKPRPNCR